MSPEGVEVVRSPEIPKSVDVYFGERRIWSFIAKPDFSGLVPWPRLLGERLFGWSQVEVRDSATGTVLFADRLVFDRQNIEFQLIDGAGRPLMINKWLRLAPMLADGERMDQRDDLTKILTRTRDLLEELGHTVFAVGGTVLGPYRDGDFLPHDDDGDLAVFFDTDAPVDVAREMMKLHRKLSDAGYRVREHSHAHLQVYPNVEGVDPKLYVDVFAAFLKDGNINQPFHVRGPFTREQLLPFSTITVRGATFNVPRDTEAWLETNYDEYWHTPQPGFRIRTPRPTVRRFRNWFGSYNMHRHFWELNASEGTISDDYERVGPQPETFTFGSRTIVNVGAGVDPLLPASVACTETDYTIQALDYADAVRGIASKTTVTPSGGKVVVSDVNLSNYRALLTFVHSLPPEPFDIYTGFTLETQDRFRRDWAYWRLIRMALKSGGSVVIDHLDTLGVEYSRSNPSSWHLDSEKLSREAQRHGLLADALGEGQVRVAGELRSYTRTRMHLEV